ncbi:class I SAM-dependent methyltransferase [Ichthyenterobacterium sp. W332]|uniref:Class I SAM-dependent methyltransferase n=1 Tax=Microcosmobacter mediterraneus TaxID=3075607 RepID=A0ABU2YMZ3_9FLAO|nr:class I SAM-dependent methyltransferase [Ichthyenterobacterium sp. W332]MDT0559187.1 class I SAM-dependent methyltransferase [Ichthyenterobacterium sp. W332]
MNSALLHKEVQNFIDDNLNSDITKLLLKGTKFKNVSTKAVVTQIEAKKRCQKKLPTWFNTANIYYPDKLNIEQTSSEATAEYKSKITSGQSIIDLTGGFGVDSYHFSKRFKQVTHCEINTELSAIAKYNFEVLNRQNVTCIPKNGLDYLQEENRKFDYMYIDPSRRHDKKGKVFFLSDCLPNVPEHLDTLFKYTDSLLIKTSPLLDLSIGIKELRTVAEIHIVAVNNEVKELLWVLKKEVKTGILIKTINITSGVPQLFNFEFKDEKKAQAEFAEPQLFLYEPNVSILKAGAFKAIGLKYNLEKLHPHTHLYTSNTLINFPGRRFKIDKVLPFNKKRLKYEKMSMVNIATRNFPESVAVLKKRFHFKDGGKIYLFFTTNIKDERIVVVCSKAE